MTSKELEDALERGSRQLALESTAPAMLAALKELLDMCGPELCRIKGISGTYRNRLRRKCEAVIAQAEGRE